MRTQRKSRKNKNKTKMHTKRKYTKRKYTKRRFLSIQVPDTLFKKTPEIKNELNSNHKSEGNIISGMRKFLSN